MGLNIELETRSNGVCELCGTADEKLQAYTVPPKKDEAPANQVVLCHNCYEAVGSGNFENTSHWRCLTGSIWSEVPAVQVLSYKILSKLPDEWAKDALDTVDLDEDAMDWAGAEDALEAEKVVHKDAYGVILETGDTVILTQSLNVKGANFIAPKGTIVRKIRLVADNAEHIEGKIEGDTIVILTKYVRKQA